MIAFSPMTRENSLETKDFEFFRQAIMERAGIAMSDAKRNLVQSRLRSHIANLGLMGFSQYQEYLRSLHRDHQEWQMFVNLLTTNKTNWFREAEHFDFLANVFVPRWLEKKKKRLNIWCAASSTGEEAYTISMVLARRFKDALNYRIIASDIDTEVLKRGENGVYPLELVRTNVPESYQRSSFVFGKKELSGWAKVKDAIKERVEFKQVNLIQHPFQFKEEFDVIFCRNAFIYFSPETVGRIVDAQYEVTSPQGILFIGHSESLQTRIGKWKYARPSIYAKGELP